MTWRRASFVVTLLGLGLIAHGAYLPAKALAAQVLLQHAWQRTLDTNAIHKPWPWADTHPVARLRAPRHGVDLIALAGATGNALAFGPGHLSQSGAPGTRDTVVFGGHRDTHFRFLQHLTAGDVLELQSADGKTLHYAVTATQVADASTSELLLEPDSHALTLVTCYPFDALRAGGTQRYVVSAHAIDL